MSVPGMDWKVFAVCMFAIAASWLIASIPLAHAAQVTISFGGSSQTTTYTPEGYINKQVTIDSATGDVRIQVSNSSSSSIDSVYVYKCQDRSPSACSVQVAPVSFSGNVDVTYAWNDVSDAARQTANIMLIVHAIGASGSRWLSFWSRGTKSAGAPPSYSMADSSISSIAITAKTIDHVTSIRSFIDIKGMLPMNPSWISSIVFSGAAGFHDIESSSPPAASAQAYYTGSSVTNIAGSYAFVFPYNGFFALNGITIANSSSYVCGDNACSASLGENSANCCLDCGVPSGYYCDMTMGPKQLGGISPSTSPSPIKVSNCNVPNTVSLLFTINNMPTGAHIVSAQYTLNGSSTPQASACTQSGNAFTCSITTPAVAGCTGTGYVLSPNSMALTIRFNNGNTSMTWGISTPIPQITVGSWTCGSFGCESNLGESQANCCYDCGCATGQ
ncbi:MAG: hypothetical protein FJY76_01070, partial [Candidatus Aenigmarchaeota archaeon]|nr:hypothetical protein [Candidatus Aenigmarchaeota archaeon]